MVDESDLRRGRKTANALWGNAASVLVGDFLYSRSFQLMVELDDMRIMRILADTTNTIAEGEVLQLLNIGNADVDEAAYLAVIERKTAVLFAAATELGGILGGLPDDQVAALRRYGMELGYAFQIADDLLDYVSDADTLGKNIGDDLAEGKPTLPLIYALAEGQRRSRRKSLRHAIEHGGLDSLDRIIASIRDSGALERTRERALAHAQAAREALAALPASRPSRCAGGPGRLFGATRVLTTRARTQRAGAVRGFGAPAGNPSFPRERWHGRCQSARIVAMSRPPYPACVFLLAAALLPRHCRRSAASYRYDTEHSQMLFSISHNGYSRLVRSTAHSHGLAALRSGRLESGRHRAGHRHGRPGHGRCRLEQGGVQAAPARLRTVPAARTSSAPASSARTIAMACFTGS